MKEPSKRVPSPHLCNVPISLITRYRLTICLFQEYRFESTVAAIEKNAGSTLPPLRNPPKMEYTDDLTNLSYLNEPAGTLWIIGYVCVCVFYAKQQLVVLNTIRTRYMQRLIYTYSGIVLIAVNPFDRVALYDPDIVQQYSGKRRGELEPHLFAIAEDAYRCMIRGQVNQTIVVSGERYNRITMSGGDHWPLI